jgi:hypothetical protein
MRKQGAVAPAQAVLEYAYTRQLDGGNLTASNFLGLAEIRLLQNQPAAAVALLRRMVLVGTDPYEGYLPAASLLARNGRAGEAAEFYASALKATPWSAPASLGVGTVELLQKIAGSRDAAYPDRVAAAQRLGQNNARGDYGSGELNLLAAGDPIPAASADKPYFVEARLAAAQQSAAPNEKVALLRAALAVRPGDTAVRATLIQAAAEAKLYDTLLMAAQRMLRERGMPFVMPPPEQGSPGEEWRMDAAESFLDTLPLDSAARSRIASALAEGFRSQQRFAPALFYYRLAETLVPAEATKRLMEVCRAEQQRRFTNSIRKPNISENFEQASLVLPKVLTGGAR